MAKSIGRTLLSGFDGLRPYQAEPPNTLAVEAGTGTGKTLAYLVPAVLSGQRVIVSTNTLNLQEQIISKEIPFIQNHIDPSLTAMCLKGRQNYLCLYRWKQFSATPQPHLYKAPPEVLMLKEWLRDTQTGDRAELDWLPDDSALWRSLSSSTNQCLGSHCPENASCFITALRRKAAKTQLLIVNHHLFFSDLALRRLGHAEVLPRYETVIFDEAHHLENIATQYFGTTFSNYQLIDLVQDVEKAALTGLSDRDKQKTVQLARALAGQSDQFMTIFPQERGRYALLPFINQTPSWDAEISALADQTIILFRHLESLAQKSETWNGLLRRCEKILFSLTSFTEEQDNSSVYWFERRERTVALSSSPIDISAELRNCLYEQVRSVIFTSATLTTGGTFNYFCDRLGLPQETETLMLETPFDYASRTLLFIPPNHFPEPNQKNYAQELHKMLYEIIMASEGRALLLFTSINAMQSAYSFLIERLDLPVLLQGSAPKSSLLELFQRQTNSVLMAVASFWEGVDVPGQALSCVVIDKLPFEVPSDPVIMARINKIKEDGGNPFFDFQVPRAILSLRQGVGRLMRSATDAGLLAIMDVRLFTKGYGRKFLKSLPPSPVSRSMDDVVIFFKETVKT